VSDPFLIALAQCESQIGSETFDPRPANLARVERALADATAQGAHLVLLGEMFLTGYRTDEWNLKYAVHLDEPDETLAALVALTAEYGVSVMVGTASVRRDEPGTVHNTAVLAGPAGVVATYDKLHVGILTMPDGTEVNEARWFTAGSTIPIWDTSFGVVGPQICYDSHFPEISRVQSINGAEILLNITASATGFEKAWEHNRAARAIENSAWYVTCSIVGEQKGDRFFGRSAVVDPEGTTIVEAKDGVEDLVVAEIDPEESARWRLRMNTMRARRPEAYGDVVKSNKIEVIR
jgi:predicted amidohydrolase